MAHWLKTFQLSETMESLTIVFQLPVDEWESFVEKHPNGNIFQTPAMFTLYNSIPNHKGFVVAVKNKENQVLGVLSSCIIAEQGLKSFFSKRSIVVGGPLIKNDDADITNYLLTAYNKAVQNKVIYTQFRNICQVNTLDGPIRNNKFVYEDHLTVLVDLTLSKEELIGNINRKRLTSIRSSVKKGLKLVLIEDEEYLTKAVQLIRLTYKRIKLPAPPDELFYNAKKILGERIQFFGSVFNDELIGVRVCLKYKDLTYDWYAGSDLQFSNLRPNDLLPMECMLWAKEANGKIYDFGGAGKPGKPYGVRDFKLQYGGKLANYGRYTRIHKKMMYRIGEFGIKMIKKSSKTSAN